MNMRGRPSRKSLVEVVLCIGLGKPGTGWSPGQAGTGWSPGQTGSPGQATTLV